MTELSMTLRALHLAGAILWIGGSVIIAFIASRASEHSVQSETKVALREVMLKFVAPAMVFAWMGGLTLLALGWEGYKRAGWMHTKLLLVFIAAGITGALSARLRKLAAGEEVSPGSLRRLSAVLIILMLLVLIMVLLGPLFMG